ncbi:MAG: GNAT family N-acetyltransferase [Actinomycetota bacterium]
MREPLFGTASRVDLWLVLEVPGVWADEVQDAIDPDSTLGRALQPALKAVPRSRLLFIKGASRGKHKTIAFYVAITDEVESRLYHFELGSYEALSEIDLFGVLAEEERYERHRDRLPLYLVCTHGTHDRCCAKFGFPTYLSLARSQPERVWQSSHVGGDRFAANVVCLPDGLYYGQVEPGEHETFLGSASAGRLHLPRWRGRSCYPAPVQAAEYLLRRSEGKTRVAAYRHWSHQRVGDVTEAAFLATESETLHTLRVEPMALEGSRALTCGSTEAKPVVSYRLLDHRMVPFAPETRSAGGMDYQLRPAAMRDYGFIYRLRRETLERYLDEIEMPPEERGPFFARFDVTRHRLISVSGEPAGAVSVLERDEALHLANLHLLPAFQNRGLGTALVREVQRQAEASRRRVTTRVLKVNPARAFYERLGFRLEGEQGPRYRMVWDP